MPYCSHQNIALVVVPSQRSHCPPRFFSFSLQQSGMRLLGHKSDFDNIVGNSRIYPIDSRISRTIWNLTFLSKSVILRRKRNGVNHGQIRLHASPLHCRKGLAPVLTVRTISTQSYWVSGRSKIAMDVSMSVLYILRPMISDTYD